MQAELILKYEFSRDPSDDFGWLSVTAQETSVTMTTGCWVQWQDIVEWAGKSLTPEGIEAEWGYTENDIYHRIIYIAFCPSGHGEGVAAKVELLDYYEPGLPVKIEFGIDSSEIETFQKNIGRMMARESEHASLKCT